MVYSSKTSSTSSVTNTTTYQCLTAEFVNSVPSPFAVSSLINVYYSCPGTNVTAEVNCNTKTNPCSVSSACCANLTGYVGNSNLVTDFGTKSWCVDNISNNSGYLYNQLSSNNPAIELSKICYPSSNSGFNIAITLGLAFIMFLAALY